MKYAYYFPAVEFVSVDGGVSVGDMRLNGGRYEGSLSSTSTTEADDMIETENESIRERVSDLEKKVLEQGDEIVCLRSTLADVLRRLNQLEGSRPVTTPLKNGSLRAVGNHTVSHNNHTVLGSQKDLRYRPNPSPDTNSNKEPVRRVPSYQTPSSLPQRRVVHYQSTGSLHSDSPSSSSVSPVPTSPSPSPTRPSAKTPPATHPHTPSGSLFLSKRWSSTGDFNSVNSPSHSSRLATKSLFNLYMKPNPLQNHSPQLKHGTRDAAYNEEEGTLRMYLRGRPVVLYAPSPLVDSYDITKVAPPPHHKLKLDWVYGYRGRDCRSNLYLLPTGEMVYFVAAIVVLYNVEEQSQRHYVGHTDDVKCLAIHPNKLLVATGQTAGHDSREGRPHIRVWNSVSLSTVCVLGIGEFERSICCLSFSKADGGALLCAVDEAHDHNISVWDWQKGDKGYKVTETKCSVDTVVAAEFHPLERNCIVTCGKAHISFWALDAGGTLYKRMGVFETRDKPKYVTCLAFTQTGDVLSGDSNGNVVVWGRGTNTIARIVRNAHEGSIFSICVLKEGSIVTAGGKDGRLIQFDSNFQPTGYEAQIAEHLGGVRTVSEGRGSQLLIGSTRNCILIGSLDVGFSPAVLGHTDELWALSPHPSLPQFLTAGFDKIVQLWDCMSRSVVWSKDIAEQAQSAAFSPDGSVIVIGAVTGRWLVMDSETREIYSVHTDGGEPIQVVKFSPDARYLALGSRDNNIYIYQVGEDMRKYSRVGRCTGHSSFITHLDWSEDSQYVRSNSGDYELLFWNAGLCRQIPQSASMRDIQWASQNCVLSFSTVGIWPENADGTDVNACERSHDSRLLATADDFGKVKLFSYPVTQPRSLCHTYGGHSSHVTNVAFLFDDSRIISIGGKDTSVLQWRLT
ncbi:echinoderm microtubule-associated protein-like 2 isoform X3 [Macrosteles quadrilineatus]|uniref:echinoderm microtubule-associated protein-like 2 isoform X3 n=2 Tax=Macrosteles quadrilineatus TaxID=74068 RepID=UPI0023E29DE2|nr:echinoderm microtubule-associated protein-like 2 isoform X3 [Macrosteles quadrilineatus]